MMLKKLSGDKQKLDLSKNIYLWYGKFYICRDKARFYEHKKDLVLLSETSILNRKKNN